MKCWEVSCDGLESHPGGVAIFLVASCYGNRDKLRQQWDTRPVRLFKLDLSCDCLGGEIWMMASITAKTVTDYTVLPTE